jgi:molybdopterin converting factor small subunit
LEESTTNPPRHETPCGFTLCGLQGDEEGSAAVQVRVRLGAGLSRLAHAPLLTVELADGATVEDLYASLRRTQPDLDGALRSALPVVAGEHVARDRRLADREELALLLPVSGG